MVDVDTIKPGDKVVYTGTDPLVIAKGVDLTVCDPPIICTATGNYISANFSDGTHAICKAKNLLHKENAETTQDRHLCTCDSFKVLMVSGCRCGAFQREREAAR